MQTVISNPTRLVALRELQKRLKALGLHPTYNARYNAVYLQLNVVSLRFVLTDDQRHKFLYAGVLSTTEATGRVYHQYGFRSNDYAGLFDRALEITAKFQTLDKELREAARETFTCDGCDGCDLQLPCEKAKAAKAAVVASPLCR